MLRKKALKKIIITTFIFFIVLTIYMIPSKNNNVSNTFYNYLKTKDVSVYLLNDYNQLTKVDFKVDDSSLEKIIESIINKLTISNDATIPNGFIQVIPNNVYLNRSYVDENIAYLDFSEELLEIDQKEIVKIVESISYSLFELDKINGVSIYCNGENISKYFDVPDIITKDYGINKRVDLKKLDDISKVVIYYVDKTDDNNYYVPITKYLNDDRDKIKIIIDELSSNYVYESNLVSLLDKNIKLLNYEIKNDSMILDFNNSIFMGQDKVLEEIVYSISYSVFANYDVSSVVFNVEGQEIAKKSSKVIE
jgi:spore germination protein GerM